MPIDADVIVIALGRRRSAGSAAIYAKPRSALVAAAATPVVSAIGHEADRPLLDEVADLRASTPTDAAKRIVPDVAEELARVQQARAHLNRGVRSLLERELDRLQQLRSRPALANPERVITVREEDIAEADGAKPVSHRIGSGPAYRLPLPPSRPGQGPVAATDAGPRLRRRPAPGPVQRSEPRNRPRPVLDLRVRVAAGEFSAVSTQTAPARDGARTPTDKSKTTQNG